MRSKSVCVKPIKLISEAETEIWEAALYDEKQERGLGSDFANEIGQSLRFIQQGPEMWPKRGREVRRYLTDRFPFVVHYRIERDLIRVIAVAHVRRKPNYWAERV